MQFKKYAFISTLKTTPWGGSEVLWYKTALKALQEGHAVGCFVCSFNEEPKQWAELKAKGAKFFYRNPFPSIVKRTLQKFIFTRAQQPAFLNSFQALKEFNPDILFITDGSTYYTANDTELANLLLSDFRNRYTILCQGNTRYHMPDNRNFAKDFFAGAKNVFFNAANNLHEAEHQLCTRLSNAAIIQNPILGTAIIAEATSATLQIAVPARYCISDKGQDILIEAIATTNLKKQEVLFNLYGSGADKEYLEALIRFYGVAEKVTLNDPTTMEAIWKKNEVLLLPSVTEGTPITLLEGMIAGKLCIATNVGGCNEWIQNGITGYLIEAPTVNLINESLTHIMEQKADWPAIRKAGFEYAKSHIDFNPETTLFNLLNQS